MGKKAREARRESEVWEVINERIKMEGWRNYFTEYWRECKKR